MSETENDTVICILTEKIHRLERHNTEIQNELEKARAISLENCLSLLRLHQVLLVYTGTESLEHLTNQLEHAFVNKEYGWLIANQTLGHLFNLNNSPLEDNEREAFRESVKGGTHRW